jgi:hypothetical protein
MSEEPVRIGLADIADVVTTPSDGQLPLIVGGQAVNIWAVTYAPKVGEAPARSAIRRAISTFKLPRKSL